jgi:DNA-binding LacI/PurR family transcriptional regulator
VANATIVEVARAAGVSVASVSNHLNGRHERMRTETRQRIDDAIRALEFRPNLAARQLKTGRSSMLGLLVPTVSNPYYGQFALCVERAAQQRGYGVLLGNTLRDPRLEQAFAAEFAAQGIGGLIMGWATSEPGALSALAKRGICMVALDMMAGGRRDSAIDLVTLDNKAATRLAIDHLAGLGHRHIAFVTAPGEARSRSDRREGFCEAIRARGLGEPVVVVGESPPTDRFGDTDLAELGRKVVGDILRLPDRPTALIALNDLTAAGLMTGLREASLSVPGDVSVVGIDDANFSRLLNPALTTVHQPAVEMAEAAVERLAAQMKEGQGEGHETIFAPTLVVRASTAPPGASK